MKAKKRLLLIDASNLFHRAFHAFPTTLTTASGETVNALFGFTKILMSVLARFEPEYAVVVLDTDTEIGWRRKLDPDYKCRRGGHSEELTPQFKHMMRAIKAMNLAHAKIEGYEADDLIGAYCHKFKGKSELEVIIVSGDKDFMQLFQLPNVCIFDDQRKNMLTEADSKKKFGVAPHQITMVQALAGDEIDDIPGVEGFGYATAAKFIGEHTSFKSLFAELKQIKKDDELIKAKTKKKFKNKHAAILKNKKRILLNFKLVTLDHTAPISHSLKGLQVSPPDPKKLTKFLKRFQFKSLMGGLDDSGVRVSVESKRKRPARSRSTAKPSGSLFEIAKKRKLAQSKKK